jgi:hypothetical protein
MLQDEEWGKWSSRRIARARAVHHDAVASARRSLANSDSEPERTYTTKHGTTATMDTTNIGQPPARIDAAM